MKPYRVVLLLTLLPFLALLGQPTAEASGRPVLDRGIFTRNVNREELAAYSELVGSDPAVLQAQMNAMVYWSDQVGWEAGGNHYFSTNQVQWPGDGYYYDLIFDGALPGESTCWQDNQHCRTMSESDIAYSWHFPDLNFQVVVWNAYYYAVNPHPSPVDGVAFWDFVMRHELGHDYFLGDDPDHCGWLMDWCGVEADVQPEELATANEEYALRPQAPTNVWVTQATSDSITLHWSGAENYRYFEPALTTTPYSDWQAYMYPWDPTATSLTFQGLSPHTRYYFRILAVTEIDGSSTLGSSSWPVEAATHCAGDQDCDGMGKSPISSNLWYCSTPGFSGGTESGVMPSSTAARHWCDADAGEGARFITEHLWNPSGVGLGSFSFKVMHSPLTAAYALDGEYGFLASTGRSVTCSGEWSPSYTSYTYSCQSSGDAPGPIGNGDLAQVVVYPGEYAYYYRPTENTNVDVLVDDVDCQANDVQLVPLPGSNEQGYLPACDGSVVTMRMLEGDVTSDCQVDLSDCQDVAFRFGLLSGREGYSQWLDLQPTVPDGRIGFKDIQFACGRWGSTCQAPVPCDQSGLTCPTPEVAKPAAAEGNANVRVDPPSQNTVVGQQFTVDVAVEAVDNLGAYELSLQFDPGKLTYVGISNGSFLGSSGREAFCVDPIVDVGSVTFGCGTYRFGTPGASGSGQLAQVTFEATGGGVSPLDLTMVDTLDPLAKEISASSENGSVSVSSAGAVGGMAEPPEDVDATHGGGRPPIGEIAMLAGIAVVAATAGGWYARRRLGRQRR